MQKIPPFGKNLYLLQESQIPVLKTIYLWIGLNAWQKARQFIKHMSVTTLLLPPWDDPNRYHWPVNNCDVLIQDTGGSDDEYIDDTVFTLYKDKAQVVRYVSPDYQLTIFKKD